MSNQSSLYRRHRPRTFADVVGQEHVVRTLSNAVEQNKVHHAYLFVGSRGTGKTSMAKILASCLNDPSGPTLTPDQNSEEFKSIVAGSSLDVIELDAASNNSVDDVRELRETVALAPLSGGYKVYILDEAHMLTAQAWNALLKTLEEPPPHTVFVLATTEANRVLPTVADRCHRFDFHKPSAAQVREVLTRVAAEENIGLPDEVAALIARHSAGSFRDALGTLEQLVTYAGSEIELPNALALLGAADFDLLCEAVESVGRRDRAAAVAVASRTLDAGIEPGSFLDQLEQHARELLVTQTLGELPMALQTAPDRDARIVQQSAAVSAADLVRLLDLIADARSAIRDGSDPRLQLEIKLLKAASPQFESNLGALLSRIEALEQDSPASPATPRSQPVIAASPAPIVEAAVEPAPHVESEPVGAPLPVEEVEPEPVKFEPEPVAVPEPEPEVALPPEPQPEAEAAQRPEPEPVAPPSSPADLEWVQHHWTAVREHVSEPSIQHILGEAHPVALDDGELTLAIPAGWDFMLDRIQRGDAREVVAAAVKQLTGQPLRLRYTLSEETGAPAELDEQELIERLKRDFDGVELQGPTANGGDEY